MELQVEWDSGRHCGILKSDQTTFELIREHFSVADKSAQIRRRYNSFIPFRKYAITPAGRFEVGLFSEIFSFCQTFKNPPKFSLTPEFKAHFRPSYSRLNTQLIALKLALRDYQAECVQKCLKLGRGAVLLATGAGKTLLAASLIRNIPNSPNFTLIIVPTIQLVEQTYQDFLAYGIPAKDMTQLSGEHTFQLGKPITIALAQYLLVSKDVPTSLFGVDLLIIDEVHGLKRGNQLDKYLKNFTTPHKYGLTGTLPEEQIDIWNIIGKIGPIIYEKSSSDLRDAGYLAEVEALLLRLHYRTPPTYSVPSLSNPLVAFNEEQQFIWDHKFRNNTIVNLTSRADQNTLVVVDRIAHGTILEQAIKAAKCNKKVYFIRGSMSVSEREKIRKQLEKKNNIVCIAISKIFSTGINVKNLHYILLAVSGKSKVRLVQSIGRGLRLHESKTKLQIFDIVDQLKYATQHEKERLKIYDKEKIPYKYVDVYEK
jgi:superfamily II DNA or RNA helicase